MARKQKEHVEGEEQQDDAPEGYRTVYGPEEISGLSIDNEQYEVVDGMAYVADEHLEEAAIHGFTTKKPK